jgi:hypothetical protein
VSLTVKDSSDVVQASGVRGTRLLLGRVRLCVCGVCVRVRLCVRVRGGVSLRSCLLSAQICAFLTRRRSRDTRAGAVCPRLPCTRPAALPPPPAPCRFGPHHARAHIRRHYHSHFLMVVVRAGPFRRMAGDLHEGRHLHVPGHHRARMRPTHRAGVPIQRLLTLSIPSPPPFNASGGRQLHFGGDAHVSVQRLGRIHHVRVCLVATLLFPPFCTSV